MTVQKSSQGYSWEGPTHLPRDHQRFFRVGKDRGQCALERHRHQARHKQRPPPVPTHLQNASQCELRMTVVSKYREVFTMSSCNDHTLASSDDPVRLDCGLTAALKNQHVPIMTKTVASMVDATASTSCGAHERRSRLFGERRSSLFGDKEYICTYTE